MVKDVRYGNTVRKSYSKVGEFLTMPNLIEVQKNSYKWFLEEGLREVFRDVAAITDYTNTIELTFIDYSMNDKPKYSVKECKERDATYAAPIKVKVRLRNRNTEEIKEQELFVGDLPVMTDNGTFVINGAERVIISQLVRSPGIYFTAKADKTDKYIYTSTIIPNRGAWLEYETDANNLFYVRIDKNRKLLVTSLIRTLGVKTDAQIRELYGEDERMIATLEKDTAKTEGEALVEIYRRLRPGEPPTVESARSLLDSLFFDPKRYDISRVGRFKYNKKLAIGPRIAGRTLALPVVDPMTGEIIAEPGEVLTREKADFLEARGVARVVLNVDGHDVVVFTNNMVDMKGFVPFDPKEIGFTEKVYFPVLETILRECGDDVEALKERLEEARNDLIPKSIIADDILASINYLNCLAYDIGTPDDTDHLGNKRLRSVGELLQNQFRIGFSRMERVIKERMSIQDLDVVTPQSLINVRPITAAIKEFFGSSPLSQFMDQTNPLAELTHKRRLSALGPGGLTRDRANFEVRDVHHSHYGRMCPIETPEGPNIGLISYLASFAKINDFGFIEAPYCRVDKETGVVSSECEYFTADQEDGFYVAMANEPMDDQHRLINDRITCRYRDEIVVVDRSRVDLMDVSPKMMISIATAMIPFVENDDANRALMGANMQRQAVPLLRPEAPVVGTGMEHKAAVDSGVCVLAEGDGIVVKSTADEIQILYDDPALGTKSHELIKFLRSNQGTCINQRPIVVAGQRVSRGEVIADGPSTDNGEISLGRNMLIGFMTWEGYNYEDAVLLNERLVRDDVFTSIHIEEYETESRDTKLGPEDITRDIPNMGEDALRELDERGIIRIGAEVHAGDILVGKV
ncbi:MAG: DNA-directed RNA polymerase subunit beta, partial [Clostridia bacterium]|nr:DNA-directed RNA polymerase subunit beta [Clostridia bacterium]